MNEIIKQFAKIEEYVRFAETLPTELSAVKVYLGYDTTNLPALSPIDMQSLFTEICGHADLWKNVSTQAEYQLRELSITAAAVVKNGNGLIRGLNALDPVAQILNKIGDSSLEESNFIGKDVALDKSTLARLNNLQPYIDALHTTSLDSLGDTNATNQLIADFRTQSSMIEAKVSGKVDKLKDGNSEVLGKEKTVGPMIEAFKEARRRIIAQLGEGSEAAIAVQEQIEKTLQELTSREPDLQKQQRLTYAVGRLFLHLQGLGYAMIEAQSALTHLWLNSSKTCTRLNSITSNLRSIGTEEILFNFYIIYKQVLTDWASIKEEAINLNKAF